jgi:hypothetical protein
MKFSRRFPLFAIALTCLSACLSACSILEAGTYNVSFDDIINNTGNGFDDPTFGATRVSTVNSVLAYIDSELDLPGALDLRFLNSETDGGGFLAAAGPLFFTGPNGFQNGTAFTHLTTNVDPIVGDDDARVTFDFGYTWNNDLSAPTVSEFDLFTVTLHEVTHGLGFLSLLGGKSPTPTVGTSGITGTDPGVFSVYDSFLERGDGTKLFTGAAGDFTGVAADLTSNDLFFGGANAKAANGGNSVQVYAPASFAQGSSLSHVQAATTMNFQVAPGIQRRSYSAQEVAILQDIGYSLASATASVPEPSSWLLMLSGTVAILITRFWKKTA